MDINYATNIALLNEDGIVENVIWGMIYQMEEFAEMASGAVAIGERDVRIGDQYRDGEWYRDGEKIDTRTTQERAEEAEAILDMLYEGGEVTDA